jgi:hypothetical protein
MSTKDRADALAGDRSRRSAATVGRRDRGCAGEVGSGVAPSVGEPVDVLWAGASARVEHIVSGRLEAPVGYDLFLPARTPHRPPSVEPGTCWLAVHARRG